MDEMRISDSYRFWRRVRVAADTCVHVIYYCNIQSVCDRYSVFSRTQTMAPGWQSPRPWAGVIKVKPNDVEKGTPHIFEDAEAAAISILPTRVRVETSRAVDPQSFRRHVWKQRGGRTNRFSVIAKLDFPSDSSFFVV